MFFYFCHLLVIMIIATLPIYYVGLDRNKFPALLGIWMYACTINNSQSTIPFVTLTKEIKLLSSENRSWHQACLDFSHKSPFTLYCPGPVIYFSSPAQRFTSTTLHKVNSCVLLQQNPKHLKYHSEVIKGLAGDDVFSFSFSFFSLWFPPFLLSSLLSSCPSFLLSFLSSFFLFTKFAALCANTSHYINRVRTTTGLYNETFQLFCI